MEIRVSLQFVSMQYVYEEHKDNAGMFLFKRNDGGN
jgi:hypothetical protein